MGALILPADSPQALDAELHCYLAGQRRVLAIIGGAIHHELYLAGIRVYAPEGGLYLLLEFSPFVDSLAQRGIVRDSDLCERLLEETGVAVLPGSAFGMSANTLSARLAYVDFDGERALLDSEQSDHAILRHADKMLRGIDCLREWLA